MAVPHQTTEAYDLSLFETKKQPTIVALKTGKKQQLEQKKHVRLQSLLNTLTAICVSVIAVAIIGLLVGSRVRLTEINNAINTRQEELNALNSKIVTLENELAAHTSAESMEAYVEAHGMQKTESYQQRYISVGGGDKIEVPEKETAWYTTFLSWLTDLF